MKYRAYIITEYETESQLECKTRKEAVQFIIDSPYRENALAIRLIRNEKDGTITGINFKYSKENGI